MYRCSAREVARGKDGVVSGGFTQLEQEAFGGARWDSRSMPYMYRRQQTCRYGQGLLRAFACSYALFFYSIEE